MLLPRMEETTDKETESQGSQKSRMLARFSRREAEDSGRCPFICALPLQASEGETQHVGGALERPLLPALT